MVPLAVGLTFGLLALVLITLGTGCYVYRRNRRTLIDLDVQSVSPRTIPPMSQASQQSSVPHDGERCPQPDQPPDVPMATDGVAMSSSGSGLEPPPSNESPMYDWRVGTAY